jgi:type II secretory pathway pseudopilin PulG
MKTNQDMKKGFTIIETLLAMTGVALMMIAIAVLVMNIGRIYNKGITIKNVNETARSVLDDLNRSISASPAIVGTDPVAHFLPNERRFCTGLVSYVWNEWSAETNNWHGHINRLGGTTISHTPARLVKVRDTNRDYCRTNPTNANQLLYPFVRNEDNPEELLGESAENLVLYGFVIFRNNDGKNINRLNGQIFYSGSFVLGTRGEGAGNASGGIDPVGLTCLPPGDDEQTGLEYYCAINKFNFAQRAMGSAL